MKRLKRFEYDNQGRLKYIYYTWCNGPLLRFNWIGSGHDWSYSARPSEEEVLAPS